MRSNYFAVLSTIFLLQGALFAQTNQTSSVEDFKPATTNQQGKLYPAVNSEGRVRASISAPEATKVQLDISAKKYDLVKALNLIPLFR